MNLNVTKRERKQISNEQIKGYYAEYPQIVVETHHFLLPNKERIATWKMFLAQKKGHIRR